MEGHFENRGRDCLMWEYQAEILRVVDGDTVDARIDLGFKVHYNVRVRLHGLNAPESRTRDKEEKISCLLYTSPSPRDATLSRMPSSA